MQITVQGEGERTVLTQQTPSSTVSFSIPLAKADFIDALKAILVDSECREHIADAVLFEKNQSAVKVHAGGGSFLIPLTHVFAIVV